MRNNARFQRGSAVYTCAVCKKQTRETGDGESSTGLCRRCFDMAGRENEIADCDQDEKARLIEEFVRDFGQQPDSWCL